MKDKLIYDLEQDSFLFLAYLMLTVFFQYIQGHTSRTHHHCHCSRCWSTPKPAYFSLFIAQVIVLVKVSVTFDS